MRRAPPLLLSRSIHPTSLPPTPFRRLERALESLLPLQKENERCAVALSKATEAARLTDERAAAAEKWAAEATAEAASLRRVLSEKHARYSGADERLDEKLRKADKGQEAAEEAQSAAERRSAALSEELDAARESLAAARSDESEARRLAEAAAEARATAEREVADPPPISSPTSAPLQSMTRMWCVSHRRPLSGWRVRCSATRWTRRLRR